MDLETEMEYCSTDITNESKSNKQSKSGNVHTCDAEDHDNGKYCIIVNKGRQQLLPV